MPLNENEIKITVHVKILAKPGRLEDLIDAFEVVYRETRQEPGCEYCEVIQNIDNPLLITLVEKFTHYQAFKAHMQMPALRHFIDHLSLDLADIIDASFHTTRISCTGDRSIPHVETLSFREDLMDRPSSRHQQ